MIEERYCSYEVAKLLKEKGFPQDYDLFHSMVYNEEDYEDEYEVQRMVTQTKLIKAGTLSSYPAGVPGSKCFCPTHQMACDWIYENYGLYVQIFLYVTLSTNKKDNSIIKKIRWTFDIVTKFPEKGPYQYYESVREEFASQYEATEAGLKYILNKI